MDKSDRTGSSVRLVRSSGAGVGASAMVVSVGAGWERLADMMRVLEICPRGNHGDDDITSMFVCY